MVGCEEMTAAELEGSADGEDILYTGGGEFAGVELRGGMKGNQAQA